MPWFVVKRPVIQDGEPGDRFEYRVVSEAEIEQIGPEWDWASGSCDTEAEAQRMADEGFWDEFD